MLIASFIVAMAGEARGQAVICGAHVFDSEHATFEEPRDVYIQDGKVERIVASGSDCLASGADHIIDGRGHTLFPGFIDTHVHYSTGAGALPGGHKSRALLARALDEQLLEHGFTTVLDPGGGESPFLGTARAAQEAKGGPEVHYAGKFFTAPGGHPAAYLDELYGWPIDNFTTGQSVVEVPSGRLDRQIEKRAAHGADVIKVVYDQLPLDAPQISKDQLHDIVVAANQAGMPVLVHSGTMTLMNEAMDAGVVNFAHLPFRYSTGEAQELLDTLVLKLDENNGWVMSTLNVHTRAHEIAVADRTHSAVPLTAAEKGTGPDDLEKVKREMVSVDLDPKADSWKAWASSIDVPLMQQAARAFHAQGRLLLGSDSTNVGTWAGSGGLREMELLVEAGIPSKEVLQMATWNNAQWLASTGILGRDQDVGAVKEGWQADLVLVDCAPQELDTVPALCLHPDRFTVVNDGELVP